MLTPSLGKLIFADLIDSWHLIPFLLLITDHCLVNHLSDYPSMLLGRIWAKLPVYCYTISFYLLDILFKHHSSRRSLLSGLNERLMFSHYCSSLYTPSAAYASAKYPLVKGFQQITEIKCLYHFNK